MNFSHFTQPRTRSIFNTKINKNTAFCKHNVTKCGVFYPLALHKPFKARVGCFGTLKPYTEYFDKSRVIVVVG